MPRHRYTVWLAALSLVATACAPSAIPPAVTLRPAPRTPTVDPSPTPRPAEGSLVDQALADLSARLGVPASEIEVVSDEAVVWPDGSLGCPQSGASYIQILVEGSRIVLKHGDATYDYHAGSSSPFLCEQAKATLRAGPTLEPVTPADVSGQGVNVNATPVAPGLQPLVDQAVADLAARLSVAPSDVEIVSAESVVWPDTSLGCPRPDMQYLQVLTDGARIELRVKGKTYAYHSGRGRGPFLCEDPATPSAPPGNPNA